MKPSQNVAFLFVILACCFAFLSTGVAQKEAPLKNLEEAQKSFDKDQEEQQLSKAISLYTSDHLEEAMEELKYLTSSENRSIAETASGVLVLCLLNKGKYDEHEIAAKDFLEAYGVNTINRSLYQDVEISLSRSLMEHELYDRAIKGFDDFINKYEFTNIEDSQCIMNARFYRLQCEAKIEKDDHTIQNAAYKFLETYPNIPDHYRTIIQEISCVRTDEENDRFEKALNLYDESDWNQARNEFDHLKSSKDRDLAVTASGMLVICLLNEKKYDDHEMAAKEFLKMYGGSNINPSLIQDVELSLSRSLAYQKAYAQAVKEFDKFINKYEYNSSDYKNSDGIMPISVMHAKWYRAQCLAEWANKMASQAAYDFLNRYPNAPYDMKKGMEFYYASGLVKEGHVKEGRDALLTFIKKYPNASESKNAKQLALQCLTFMGDYEAVLDKNFVDGDKDGLDFIEFHIYNKPYAQEKYDEAVKSFEQYLSKKPPYEYAVAARLHLARSYENLAINANYLNSRYAFELAYNVRIELANELRQKIQNTPITSKLNSYENIFLEVLIDLQMFDEASMWGSKIFESKPVRTSHWISAGYCLAYALNKLEKKQESMKVLDIMIKEDPISPDLVDHMPTRILFDRCILAEEMEDFEMINFLIKKIAIQPKTIWSNKALQHFERYTD